MRSSTLLLHGGYRRQQATCIVLFVSVLLLLGVALAWIKTQWLSGYQLGLIFLGWFTASFIEYYIHRFLYHQKSRQQKTFLADHHQYHHSHPSEIHLSTGAKAAALILLTVLLVLGFFKASSFLFAAGLTCGFCAYAFMHKAIHQPWSARVFPRLFRYHIYHHCKYPNTCFGVSTTLWDQVFRTTPPAGAFISKRILQFYLAQHGEDPAATTTLLPATADKFLQHTN